MDLRSRPRGEAGVWVRNGVSAAVGDLESGKTKRKDVCTRMEINGEQVNGTKTYAELGLSEAIMRAIEKKGLCPGHPRSGGSIPFFMEWKDVIAKPPRHRQNLCLRHPHGGACGPREQRRAGPGAGSHPGTGHSDPGRAAGLCAFKEGVRTVCLYGGQPIDKQITQLKKHPQIVVATPGRLMDHMKRRTVRLDKVQTVVLDEADRMLDMGFVRDVTRILDQLKHRRNLGMFSATISREVMDISWVYQRDPVEITVRPVEESKPDITQYRIDLDGREQKLDTIAASSPTGSTSGPSPSATPRT